jgi:hypothetical protein
MNRMKSVMQLSLLVIAGVLGANSYASSVVDSMLTEYQQQGAVMPDANSGREIWFSTHGDRSCSSCHSDSPLKSGSHVKTGKLIEPMALSVNPDRYQESKKIEKWFLRNCKWTLGRECSAQEKSNILSWLSSQ